MPVLAEKYEDRRYSRRWIINETVEIVVGDKSADFLIVDVSAGGARVISEMDLEPGMKVVLQLPEDVQLMAKVVHTQSDGVGIQFKVGAADRTKMFDWISKTVNRNNND